MQSSKIQPQLCIIDRYLLIAIALTARVGQVGAGAVSPTGVQRKPETRVNCALLSPRRGPFNLSGRVLAPEANIPDSLEYPLFIGPERINTDGSVMEAQLKSLEPTASFGACSEYCTLAGFKVEDGTLRVPSNYASNLGSYFNLGFSRVTNEDAKDIKYHLLMLNGGPGSGGRHYRDLIEVLSHTFQGQIAFYEVDHRGLGRSGAFKSFKYVNRTEITQALNSGPFPYKDLNLKNAALDLGMVALTIQKTEIWQPGARIGLYGFSYGARWGHAAISLLPNTFDFAVIGGLQSLGPHADGSATGLYEHCERSEACSMHFGGPGKVAKTAETMLKNLIKSDYNQCTSAMHEAMGNVIEAETSTWYKVGALMYAMDPIFTCRVGISGKAPWPGHRTVCPPHVGLAFLKATHDCLDPQAYKSTILPMMRKFFTRTSFSINSSPIPPSLLTFSADKYAPEEEDQPTNSTVNWLILCRHDHYQPPPMKEVDVSPRRYIYAYFRKVLSLLPMDVLKAERFNEVPAITSKTRIGIYGSALDLTTPPGLGHKLFRQIRAPWKGWMHFKHHFHTIVTSQALLDFISATIHGDNGALLEEIRQEVKKVNQRFKPDWTFSQAPIFKELWAQAEKTPVASSGKLKKVPFSLPNCEFVIGDKVESTDGPSVVGVLCVVALLSVMAILIVVGVRKYKVLRARRNVGATV